MFYFKVAMKISDTSDGALSEGLSTYASRYYLKQNNDFMEFTKDYSSNQINKWVDFVAFDLDISSDTTSYYKNIENELVNLIGQCSSCTDADIIRLKGYNKQILATKDGK